MGISIKHVISLLAVMSSAFIYLPYAEGGCGGSCGLSSGGSSYNFLDDPGFNVDMSSFDEFMRDNLGDQTTLNAKSLSQDLPLDANSSLSQTGNASQNGFAVGPVTDSSANTTSDNGAIKLGASGIQDKRVSTLAFAIFN
ncbi:MAG: hypothetical protein LUQ59_11385 [Methanothrix sp.]|nr:hypothetical protein [Methanothrix sp.]